MKVPFYLQIDHQKVRDSFISKLRENFKNVETSYIMDSHEDYENMDYFLWKTQRKVLGFQTIDILPSTTPSSLIDEIIDETDEVWSMYRYTNKLKVQFFTLRKKMGILQDYVTTRLIFIVFD